MATPACFFVHEPKMTMFREVRILALWRDDPTEAPLTVDLRVDVQSGAVVGQWDVFGAFDLDGKECRPFVLRRDGAIEFGDGERGKRPPRKTNLRDVAIKVGARFFVQWNEEDRGEYSVVKVAVLGAKDGAT
jgi:hypothetical protein